MNGVLSGLPSYVSREFFDKVLKSIPDMPNLATLEYATVYEDKSFPFTASDGTIVHGFIRGRGGKTVWIIETPPEQSQGEVK